MLGVAVAVLLVIITAIIILFLLRKKKGFRFKHNVTAGVHNPSYGKYTSVLNKKCSNTLRAIRIDIIGSFSMLMLAYPTFLYAGEVVAAKYIRSTDTAQVYPNFQEDSHLYAVPDNEQPYEIVSCYIHIPLTARLMFSF